MLRLGRCLTMGTPLHAVDELAETYRALTPDDVQRVAAEFLDQEPTVAVVSPYDAQTVEGLLGE